MPLLQYLSTLNQSASSSNRSSKSIASSSKSKTRSHSVPHFNQLKSTSSASGATESGASADVGSGSGSEEQAVVQEVVGSSQKQSTTDSSSLDNRSTHSAEQQQQQSSSTPVSEESPQVDLVGLASEPAFFIAPISDAAAVDPFENITDDEKRRMTIACTSSGTTSKPNQNGYHDFFVMLRN